MQFASTRERADLHRRRDIITDSIGRIEQRRGELARRREPYKADSVEFRALGVLIAECDESLRVLGKQAKRHDEQARRCGEPLIEYRIG